MLKNISEKISIFTRVVQLVYRIDPVLAFVRDILLFIVIWLTMESIKIGGQFIDSTASLLSTWNTFNITDYIYTESFYYLSLGLSIWMVITSLNAIREYVYQVVVKKLTYHMQGELLEVLSKSNLEDVESKKFRDLLTMVPTFGYENVIGIYGQYSVGLNGLIKSVSAIVILFSTMGISSLLVITFPLLENIFGHINRQKRKRYNDDSVETIKKTNYLETLMTRIPYFAELRVDNTFKYLKNTYATDSKKYMDGLISLDGHFYIDSTLGTVLGRLFAMIYVVFALAYAFTVKLSIGSFKAIYDYIQTAYDGLNEFYSAFFRISTFIDYAKSYFEYIDFKGFGDVEHGQIVLKDQTPRLTIKNLKFNYPGTSKLTLKDIDLDIAPGSNIAVIGGDGSGKSSLIKVMCGLYKIDGGEYLVDGYRIQDLHRGQLKKQISVVFQDFVNYNLSIKENIALTHLGKYLNRKVYDQVIKICEIDKMMKKEDLDEDQILGKYFSNGKELSPGYWQRLAIARMLYRNKNVLIMDEPFTYIDGKAKERILKNVLQFAGKEKTVIYITQDHDLKHLFDNVLYLKDGKIYSEDKS